MRYRSKFKVLMTADTVGGVWTYASGLASALATSGADVCLVTMGPRANSDQREMLSSSIQMIESDLALEWQDPGGRDIAHAREFLRAMEQRIKPDVIHLNSYREGTFGWNAPVIVVAHSCVNSWGAACGDNAFLAEPKWQRYTELVAEGIDHADAWVAPTRAFGDVVHELYQPRSQPIVIRNSMPGGAGLPAEKKPLILAAGRMWDAAKNLSVLAEAGKDLDWPLFVAGTPAASSKKLASGIELLGALSHSELAARLQRAAIFVSPARYEPFGLSVLEAAGAGCALVLSDIASFRELWTGAARFVAPDDVHGFRAALTDLCADARRRTRLQRAAFARAKRYSTKRMTAAYARLYGSLLPRRSSARPRALEVRA